LSGDDLPDNEDVEEPQVIEHQASEPIPGSTEVQKTDSAKIGESAAIKAGEVKSAQRQMSLE